jgi:hypothetical protein
MPLVSTGLGPLLISAVNVPWLEGGAGWVAVLE